MEDKVIAKMKQTMIDFYTEDPSTCGDVSRIISERHAGRIASMLDDKSITILAGGATPTPDDPRYISPTLIKANPDSKCMQEEIFGPILPIITVDSVADAIKMIKRGEKPLALYAFGSSAEATMVVDSTSSGGACINDVCMHVGNTALPFGGVGQSGIGSYHGQKGFETFSHLKSVLEKGGYGARFRQKFTLEDAIGSHACSLEANTRVTNGIPLGSSFL
jgi:aldehyde dehydrogenase (NAD+)